MGDEGENRGDVGEYEGEVAWKDGDVGEYAGLVIANAGDCGEKPGDVAYRGLVMDILGEDGE